MQFDARKAKLLQAGQHMIVEGCPGLRLVATASTRTWTYRYRSPDDGRMRQVKLGGWPAMSPAAAAGAWAEVRAARESGDDPAKQRRQARAQRQVEAARQGRRGGGGVYTVRALVDDYLAGHIMMRRKPKGAAEVARLFDRLLGPLVSVPAAAVTRRQAFELLEALAGTPVQAQQLRQELGGAWDYALDAGRLPETAVNWWRLVMRGRLRSKGAVREGVHRGTDRRVLTAAEVGALVRWLPNFSRLVEDVLVLYLWTGARGAEILTIEVGEVTQEADGWWWTVPKAKTKNARHANATDLRVPLVGRALAVVQRRLLQTPAGWLFPARPPATGPVQQKTIGMTVWGAQPYCRLERERGRPRLPVTHWSPHDLRRTVRTQLAALGCPSDVAESVLGHVLPGVEGVYNRHRYDAERRAWLTRWADHIEALAAPPGGGA